MLIDLSPEVIQEIEYAFTSRATTLQYNANVELRHYNGPIDTFWVSRINNLVNAREQFRIAVRNGK